MSTSSETDSSNLVSPVTPDTPTPVTSHSSRNKVSFKELKKQLKEIDKLKKESLDIKSWVSELRLWIKYQDITDSETIFNACVLTSAGEPREVIQSLIEDDSDTEEEDHSNTYPNLDEIVSKLEKFYGTKEDQHVLIRELRALRIRKNEKVKDFNIRYRSLYLKLDKKRRKQVSSLDYAESLVNNKEAWKKVTLKDDISLEKAFTIAEKCDRLTTRINSDGIENSYPTSSSKPKNFTKYNFTKKNNHSEPHKEKKDAEVDELTKRMKKLTISVCYYCGQEGHIIKSCPELQSKISDNKKKYLEEHHLNY